MDVTWKALKEVEERMKRFESNRLRKIVKIKWERHIAEEKVRKRSGQASVIKKMNIKRGHTWSMCC